MNKLKIIGITFIFIAIAVFSLGLSTYVWPTTNAKVIEIKKNHTYISDQYKDNFTKKPKVDYVSIITVAINYEYVIDGTKYTSNLISIFNKRKIPLYGTYLPKNGSQISIKYFPFYKNLSIIDTGPSVYFSGIMFFLGIVLINLKYVLLWFYRALLFRK